MQTICMLFGGPDRRIVDGKGKTWRFEDHPYCGPSVVDRHGDPKDVQPPEGSPFWDAVTHWAQQGKRLANGNWCVWDKPTPQKLRHIGGMHYMLVTDKQASKLELTDHDDRRHTEDRGRWFGRTTCWAAGAGALEICRSVRIDARGG